MVDICMELLLIISHVTKNALILLRPLSYIGSSIFRIIGRSKPF